MLQIKNLWEDTRVYRRFDKETEHYIIEDGMCNEFEMDYLENWNELATRINVVMDKWTDLFVIPAKEVIDWPKNDWFYIY